MREDRARLGSRSLRRAVAQVLGRLARWLERRVAPPPPEPEAPADGPPAHWVERVRRGAPDLLRPPHRVPIGRSADERVAEAPRGDEPAQPSEIRVPLKGVEAAAVEQDSARSHRASRERETEAPPATPVPAWTRSVAPLPGPDRNAPAVVVSAASPERSRHPLGDSPITRSETQPPVKPRLVTDEAPRREPASPKDAAPRLTGPVIPVPDPGVLEWTAGQPWHEPAAGWSSAGSVSARVPGEHVERVAFPTLPMSAPAHASAPDALRTGHLPEEPRTVSAPGEWRKISPSPQWPELLDEPLPEPHPTAGTVLDALERRWRVNREQEGAPWSASPF